MSPSLVREEEVQSVPGYLEDEGSDKVLAREGEDKHNLGMGTPQVLQGLGNTTIHLSDKTRKGGSKSQWFGWSVTLKLVQNDLVWTGVALLEDPITEAWSLESNE